MLRHFPLLMQACADDKCDEPEKIAHDAPHVDGTGMVGVPTQLSAPATGQRAAWEKAGLAATSLVKPSERAVKCVAP